jgi:hypothetical protein
MRVLIYKRTHRGDPDRQGLFGNEDCMGRVRNWDFDAVIGIGGKSSWKDHEGIREKINWIGLGPKKVPSPDRRGDCVVFEHFALYEDDGVNIKTVYPKLYEFMYGNRKRFAMPLQLEEAVYEEVLLILNSISDEPKSLAYDITNLDNLESQIHDETTTCGGCFKGKDVELHISEC